MRDCILKAHIDLKIKSKLEEEDFDLIKQLVDALNPIKTTVEVLCRRDSNLVKADVALDVLLCYLKEQESNVAFLLYESLIDELKKRR